MLRLCTVKTPNYGSKLGNKCSNLYECDGRVPPVTLSQVRASESKIRPVVGRFDCASAHPGRGHGCSRGGEEQSGSILRPWNEIYRRNGSLKYEPWGFGTNSPGCWENISNLVCTPSFGYETPVVTQIEPLRRHIPSWLTGQQLEPAAAGWGATRATAAILAAKPFGSTV